MWNDNKYVISQKILPMGKAFHIRNGTNCIVGFSHMKAFKLKEDIRVYSDESMSMEILNIKQQQILNFSGTFAVKDAMSQEIVGLVGRKGFSSMFRDTWKILGPSNDELAVVQEKGGLMAAARRLSKYLALAPKTYLITSGGKKIAQIGQKIELTGFTYTVEIDPNCPVDRRLIISAALMMGMIEQGRGG